MAPPDAGFVDRLRMIAEAAARKAAALTDLEEEAPGRWWQRQAGFPGNALSYELRPGGNRPGPAELWVRFDGIVARLSAAMEAHSAPAETPTPTPTSWAHHSACAWTAAWLTFRERSYLGSRELLVDDRWSAPLDWTDSHSAKRSGHRPDLVTWVDPRYPIAVEVELASKSQSRLSAILRLHLRWAFAGHTSGVMYICGDERGQERITSAAERVGPFASSDLLHVELLETIMAPATETYEQHRGSRRVTMG